MLGDDIADLLPELRPYQRRAAYWMVQRERGDPITLGDKEDNQFISPLSISVGFLDSATKMFLNPFSGNISLTPEYFSPRIQGGILAGMNNLRLHFASMYYIIRKLFTRIILF
jgi:E3 ubiquitin-protein ligase SHPRH